MSESTTKGLVKNKIENFEDYPTKQDIQVNDIIYFKEDSYKNNEEYNWLTDIFRKSSKKQNGERGTPDYVVIKKNSNTIVIIECKGNLKYHSKKENINNYEKEGYGTPNDTINYAIDGALWYAQFLKDRYDIVTIAVSGITELESRVTSFIYPKNGSIKDIKLLEDGTLENCLLPINEYEKNIESILGRTIFTEEEIKKELRKYTLACTNYLRRNGIEDNSKAGLISAIVLGLTNKESRLYKVIKKSFENKIIQDDIGKEATKMLKESLYGSGKDEDEEDYIKGIFDIDNIPKGKKNSLKPELIETFGNDNPLKGSDSYTVYVNKIEKQPELVNYIETIAGVRKVNSNGSTVSGFSAINSLVGVISITIIGLLLAVAIFLISTTIAMGISVRKEEIFIMRMVGATDFFISAPFIIEGIVIGLVGAILPLILLYFIYERAIVVLSERFNALVNVLVFIDTKKEFMLLTPISLAIGVGIGFAGSFFTVRRHIDV